MRTDLVLVDREILLTELRQVFDTQTASTLLGVLDKVAAQVRAAGPTREDFSELRQIIVELAESHQRAEARLTRLEEAVAALIEAQQRAEARLTRLEEAVAALIEAQQRAEARLTRLEEAVAALIEAQQRAEARLTRLEETVAALVEAHRRAEVRLTRLEEAVAALEEAVAALVEAQQRTEFRLAELIASHQRLVDKVSGIEGRTLEQAYREKAVAYFGRLLRRPQVVSLNSLWDVLEAQLTSDQLDEALLLDLVVRGRPRLGEDREDVWLAVEVSVVVDMGDVTRARRRAELLRRAGYRAIPVVAGKSATLEAEAEARDQSIVMLQDGRSSLWDEALAKWIV